MPAQVNASLARVTGATAATGGRDVYDDPTAGEPGGAGAVKWEPAGPDNIVDAYYAEQRARHQSDAGVDVDVLRSLIIDTLAYRATGIDTDDVLTIIGPDGAAFTARAASIRASELDGIPPELQTTKLDLEIG